MAIYIPPPNSTGSGGGGGGSLVNPRLVFRESFTATISSNEYQLTGAITNGNFSTGSWTSSRILTALVSSITDWNYKAIYDSPYIFVRNRINVTSIDNMGNVTLTGDPMVGQNFYIWYWYELAVTDTIDNYYRDEYITSIEAQDPELAQSVLVNTTNFTDILNNTDSNVQSALQTLDVHTHPNLSIVSLNNVSNPGGDIEIVGEGGIYIIPSQLTNSIVIGVSGISGSGGGFQGLSGFSGYSGSKGTSGASGFSGASGYSGFSGVNGISGMSGYSGFSGKSGYSGMAGISFAIPLNQVVVGTGTTTPSSFPTLTFDGTNLKVVGTISVDPTNGNTFSNQLYGPQVGNPGITGIGGNVYVGQNIATGQIGGDGNTAMGLFVLTSLVNGIGNLAFGAEAGNSLVNSNYNALFGSGALTYGTGNQNTVLGTFAGSAIIVGDNNNIFGYNSFSNATGGASNIVIGTNAGSDIVDDQTNNTLIIGDNVNDPEQFAINDIYIHSGISKPKGPLFHGNYEYSGVVYFDNKINITPTVQISAANGDIWMSSTGVNLQANGLKLFISTPSVAEVSAGNYFLNANGSWNVVNISGSSGYSGFSGFSGTSGYSGYSGFSGTSGFSGYSGINPTPISVYQGTVNCDPINTLYSVSHTSSIYPPMVSLSVPTTGSTQFVLSVVNQTQTAFQVLLSGTPEITGYSINWLIVDPT